MSYCVNCGVELEPSLKKCPLCNTPVINPRQIEEERLHPDKKAPTPSFPQKKGQVEVVKRKDVAILLTTVVLATSIVCGLLNFFAFPSIPWSLAIIGACVLLWVLLIPAAIYSRLPGYVSIFLDGLAVVLYLYLLTYLTGSSAWFAGLGVPITVLVAVLTEVVYLCVKLFPKSFLTSALYGFTGLAILCIGLEIFIDNFLYQAVSLGWSAIVLTVCVIMDITIITLLSRKRLRSAVRRRLHF